MREHGARAIAAHLVPVAVSAELCVDLLEVRNNGVRLQIAVCREIDRCPWCLAGVRGLMERQQAMLVAGDRREVLPRGRRSGLPYSDDVSAGRRDRLSLGAGQRILPAVRGRVEEV